MYDDDDDVSVMDTYRMVMVKATIYLYKLGAEPKKKHITNSQLQTIRA